MAGHHPPDLPSRERDSCGIGFIADIGGRRRHRVLEMALEALSNLDHRGAVSADGRTGDGTGVLTQLPHRLLRAHLESRGGTDSYPGHHHGMIDLPSHAHSFPPF